MSENIHLSQEDYLVYKKVVSNAEKQHEANVMMKDEKKGIIDKFSTYAKKITEIFEAKLEENRANMVAELKAKGLSEEFEDEQEEIVESNSYKPPNQNLVFLIQKLLEKHGGKTICSSELRKIAIRFRVKVPADLWHSNIKRLEEQGLITKTDRWPNWYAQDGRGRPPTFYTVGSALKKIQKPVNNRPTSSGFVKKPKLRAE